MRELLIYADESLDEGPFFSNFFGGAAISSQHLDEVIGRLEAAKAEQGIGAEVKWQKVSSLYLPRYEAFASEVFDLLDEGKMRLRVMFTQNRRVTGNLSPYHRENRFQLLYYQFIKHAFGLQHANPGTDPMSVRLYLDELPVPAHQVSIFRGYIHALERDRSFRDAKIRFPLDQIVEVRSHEHVALQAVDIVVGAMQFRLNKMHERKPAGARVRGNRTRAKEGLYKHIRRRVLSGYPNFNIGISTGHGGDAANRWRHPYRHWLFQSQDRSDID